MNWICLVLCGTGAFLLATSDAYVNMSSANIVGATVDSQFSAKAVAGGIVVALLALGSIAAITKNKLDNVFIYLITIVAATFSAALTVQSVSIDYASNDHSGDIQKSVRKASKANIDQLKKDYSNNAKLWKECERDRYFGSHSCKHTQREMKRISALIAANNDQIVSSVRSEEVDITKAIYEKSGIHGDILERIMIYSRAIAVPFLVVILMSGFWQFWSRIWTKGSPGIAKKKVQNAA